MSSSYRFLLGGASHTDKPGLLFALLRQSPSTAQRAHEHEHLLESEQYRYTMVERGGPDELTQYLLKEASHLDALILCVDAASTQQPDFAPQLELLQRLAVPLHAIVLTKTSAFSAHNLTILEDKLRQTLKRYDLFCEQLVLLRYTHEDQDELARELLATLDERVSFANPRPTPADLPLRIFLRPRRRTINGRLYLLGSLVQGTLSVGDQVVTEAWRGRTEVSALCLAHDPETPLSEVRADDTPLEIFFSVSGSLYGGQFSGLRVTHPGPTPSTCRSRALVYLPAACLQALDPSQLKEIEARFAPAYQGTTLNLRLLPAGKALLPGGFALAELQDPRGLLLVDPGMFFTWQTSPNYPGPRLEAIGRVLELF